MVALLEEFNPCPEKTDSLAKKCSTANFLETSNRVGDLLSQSQDLRPVKELCSYKNASGHSYGPFGELVSEVGTYAQENTYKFSTKPQDTETGYYYYGYRYYNSNLGRWLNRDPLGEMGHEVQKYSNKLLNWKDLFNRIYIRKIADTYSLFSNIEYESVEQLEENFDELIELLVILSVTNTAANSDQNLYFDDIQDEYNAYSFVLNNGINLFDLFGLQSSRCNWKKPNQSVNWSQFTSYLSGQVINSALGAALWSGFATAVVTKGNVMKSVKMAGVGALGGASAGLRKGISQNPAFGTAPKRHGNPRN